MIPGWLLHNGELYFDLPGLGDNRGLATTFINTLFIQNILEKANSVKIIFVSGYDELTASRGELFKIFKNIAEKFIPVELIQNSSILVVTKYTCNKSEDELKSELRRYLGNDIYLIKPWIDDDRILKFSQPLNKNLNENDKVKILNMLNSITPKK